MIPNSNGNALYDQRQVRGHDFLAYLRSHLTAICLLFWFFTISVSVTASAIYLLKKMEKENRKTNLPTTAKTKPTVKLGGGGREDDSDDNYNDAYANYDVLGFLIDALYAGDEENSYNRSKQASKSTKGSTTPKPEFVYPGPDDSEGDGDGTEGGTTVSESAHYYENDNQLTG